MKTGGYFGAIIAAVVSVMLMLAGCASSGEKRPQAVYNVKIVQLDTIPSLNEAREAVIETLRNSDLARRSEIRVDWASAGGEQLTAAEIIGDMADEHPDLLITLSTTCLEQALKVTLDQPVVFAVAINPFILGLDRTVPELDRPVTGWYVEPPMEALIRISRMVAPKMRHVGVLWNPSDFGSRYDMLALRKAARSAGLEIVEARIRHPDTIMEKVGELKALGADILVFFSDPVVARGVEHISAFVRDAAIPVISNGVIEARNIALVEVGFDTRAWGTAAGKTAVRVLSGEDARTIAPQEFHDLKIIVNKEVARSLNLTIPNEVLTEADRVIE